jgi:4-amino-4-deoxy-L-arabinose transferase-like glycosyltransferase
VIAAPSSDPRPARLRLAALLLVALALRLAWASTQPVTDESIDRLPDQREYLALGINLLHGQGLKFFDTRFGDDVWAYRTPGYPLLIAACGGSVRAVRVVQAVLDASTVLAAYLLARRWLRPGAALVAGALVAFNPFLIYFTGLILSETLFTAMLLWGMFLLVGAPAQAEVSAQREDDGVRAAGWPATTRWLLGVFLLAASVLVRQSGIGLPLVLGVAAAVVNREWGTPYHRRWPLPVGATVVLVTFLVLLPWAWRNDRVLGEWVWTATNGGITLYDGFNPDATGASNQSFVADMPELRRMGETGRSEYLSDLAKQFIRQQPRRAAELAVVKAARTWSPVPLSQEYGGWKYRTVGLLYTVPLDVLVVLGLLRGATSGGGLPRPAKVFLLLPAIYFTVVHMLSVGSLRYRIPAEPPMAVVAASVAALPAASFRRSGRGFGVLPGVVPQESD